MIYKVEELEVIGNWVVEYDILILVDDIYGWLVYNGNIFIFILSFLEFIWN